MKGARWYMSSLILALVMCLLAAPEEGVVHSGGDGAGSVAMQSPRIGPKLDVWSGDGVNNLWPAVAYNNRHDEYLVVWENDRGATRDIYARRVSDDGSVKSWFAVATGAGEEREACDVAYSPAQDEYLVVYLFDDPTTNYDVWGVRVSWDGAWIGPQFPIVQEADDQKRPAVAYNSQDDEYLVVYRNTWADQYDVAAQRVRASDGSLLSWANVATGAGEFRAGADVTYNAARNQYLITYVYWPGSGASDIRGKVAAADLADVTAGSEVKIYEGSSAELIPRVAAGPDEYLVVWGSSGIQYDVIARRVAGDGIPQGPAGGLPIDSAPMCKWCMPAVAYGAGYGYLVSWGREYSLTDSDVYARYVMPGQDPAAGGEFAVDDDAGLQAAPAVACAPWGDCLVVELECLSSGSDSEIRGRLVMPYRVYLPLVLK